MLVMGFRSTAHWAANELRYYSKLTGWYLMHSFDSDLS